MPRQTAISPSTSASTIPTTFSAGVRQEEMIFVGGQAALGPDGQVLHPGRLAAQCEAAADGVERVLGNLGADLADVVKLVCFYVTHGEVDEAALVAQLRRRFAANPAPALTIVPLPALSHPELLIELECIAMRRPDGGHFERHAGNPAGHWPWPFNHGLRCGEMLFLGGQKPLDAEGGLRAEGDIVEQARINIDNIARVARSLGADLDDICRFNTFYVGIGTSEDWAKAAEVRGNAFERPGVCGTGVPVPALYPAGLGILQEATGKLGTDGARLPRRPSLPEGHWDWPIPVKAQQGVRIGRMVMIGGQISADEASRALDPGDLAAQTARCMDYIEAVVRDLGGSMRDIVKVNAFYASDGSDSARYQRVLKVISERFSAPGPVFTGIPLRVLGLTGLEIEVEAYALLEDRSDTQESDL